MIRIGQSTDIHPLKEGRPLILGGGINSLRILKEVVSKMKNLNYQVGNIDAIVLIEKPKLAPYIPKMKEVLTQILEIEDNQLNIKATRGEKLGFVGRLEGVVAQAVCLLVEVNHV